MKPDAFERMNQALELIQGTDLGAPLLWLYTWDIVKYNLDSEDYAVHVTEEEAWDELVKAVDNNVGFTLEYGSEHLYEHVRDWMIEAGLIEDFEDVSSD